MALDKIIKQLPDEHRAFVQGELVRGLAKGWNVTHEAGSR